MKSKWLWLIKISRWRFWLYLGGTYLVGYSWGSQTMADFVNWRFWLLLIYFLIPANLLLYGINDYFDWDTDRHNPKKQDKEVLLAKPDKKFLKKTLTGILIVTGGLMIGLQVEEKYLMLVFVVLAYGYSAPPLRFKARPGWDFLSNLLYIVPGWLGFVQTGNKPISPALLLGFFAWAWAMHLFSAIPDITADRKAGIKTTAVVLGKINSLWLCTGFWIVFSGLIMFFGRQYSVSWLVLIYPLIPLTMLFKPNLKIDKIYWYFPYLNALFGFGLFCLAIMNKLT